MTGMPAALRARVLAAANDAATRQRPAPPIPTPRGHDGATADALRRELLEGIELGEARVKLRALPQVGAFPQLLSSTSTEELRKASDLLQRAGRKPQARDVLADPGKRLKKLGLETGYDTRHDVFLHAPLEPWTGPAGSMKLYGDLMRAADGATGIGDYHGPDLASIEWMRDEDLVSVGDDGRLHALSDARAPKVRKYPGAPVPDGRAKIGRTLRQHARGLVLAAIFNLSSGKTVRRGRKRRGGGLETADGIRITGAAVASEANAIKAKRPDLAEYRYLSLSTAREVIRDLIELEILDEISPPKPTRQRRSWRTMPRVIRRLTAETADALGLRPKEAS